MNLLGLFPGQGSQNVGMGKLLWEQSALARDLFRIADEALGFELSKLCFEGPAEKLNETQIAQPAILTVSTICFRIFASVKPELRLAAAAGHSLGEFSALVAAGSLKFEDAVKLVHRRGRYMQEAVPLGAGKMVAVLGKEIAELESACAAVASSGIVEIANVNSPGQTVVAGESGAVDAFISHLSGARVIDLPVTVPSHTSLMKKAGEKLRKDLEQLEIKPCAFPVFANYTAKPVSEPEQLRENLIAQLSNRVLWSDSMRAALDSLKPVTTIEFGSGNVLSGLLRRIQPDVTRLNADCVEAIEKLVV